MAIRKNTSGQTIPVYFVDSSGDPLTGDAANITAYISLDGGVPATTVDVNPTELSATHAPGIYHFSLDLDETNCNMFVLVATSTTSGAKSSPVIVYTESATQVYVPGGSHAYTGTSATLDQLLSDLMYEVSAGDIPDLVRLSNRVLRQIALKRDWRYYQTKDSITVEAAYTTGTVDVTNGSATVTGTGTVFDSSWVGRKFMVSSTTGVFTIASYVSPTEITITPVWPYDSDTDLSYWIFQNEVAVPQNLMRLTHDGLVDAITQQPLKPNTKGRALRKWFGYVYTDIDIVRVSPVTWPWEYCQWGMDSANIPKLVFNAVGESDRVLDLYYYRYPDTVSAIHERPDIPEFLEEYFLQCLAEKYRGRVVSKDEASTAFRSDRLRISKEEKAEAYAAAIEADSRLVVPDIRNQRVVF